MRLRISGPQASVAAIAASTASAVGWPGRDCEPADEHRLARRARASACEHRLRRADRACRRRTARSRSASMRAMSKFSSQRARRGRLRRSDRSACRGGPRARAVGVGPTIAGRRRQDRCWARCRLRERLAPPRAQASPCRLTSAAIATSISLLVVLAAELVQQGKATFASSGCCAASSIERRAGCVTCVFGVHLRGARCILHRLARRIPRRSGD